MVRARTESAVSEASTVGVPSARERSLSNLFAAGEDEEALEGGPAQTEKCRSQIGGRLSAALTNARNWILHTSKMLESGSRTEHCVRAMPSCIA